MSETKPKFPQLGKCEYDMLGLCATAGCQLQALMDNSKDMGTNEAANKRREELEKTADDVNCGQRPLVRP